MVNEPGCNAIVTGGRVIDPANGVDAVRDIGTRDGQVFNAGADHD